MKTKSEAKEISIRCNYLSKALSTPYISAYFEYNNFKEEINAMYGHKKFVVNVGMDSIEASMRDAIREVYRVINEGDY